MSRPPSADMSVQPKRAACSVCLRPQRACICDLTTRIAHRTQVLILQHPLEARQAKGSARLMHHCLPVSRIVVGEQFDAEDLHTLVFGPWDATPGQDSNGQQTIHPILLYPQTPHAPEAAQEALPVPGMRYRLVIVDATWRKSRKMLYANPLLATLPRLSLSPGAESRYAIRKAHRPGQLATLEAAAYALMRLEGSSEHFLPMLHAFDAFVARQMHFARSSAEPLA